MQGVVRLVDVKADIKPDETTSRRPRVQLRLALDDIASVERDLAVLSNAVERCKRILRAKHRDPASLASVRLVLEEANRHMNATRRGR